MAREDGVIEILAKQARRIQKHPNSLVATVLKAKYFKNSDFMNSKVGYKPYRMWRSIMWEEQLL